MNAHVTQQRRLSLRPSRSGVTIFETFVALTLLSTTLAVAAPLLVRHSRLLVSARHYRLACDELANQIERLSALPAGDVARAIADLEPSPFAAERLPSATLSAALDDDEPGRRLTLAIAWEEPGRRQAPVTLAAWIGDASDDAPDANPDAAPATDSREDAAESSSGSTAEENAP